MSRIDDAMKRAAAGASGRGRAAEGLLKLADDLTLDLYPVEVSTKERSGARVAVDQCSSSAPKVGAFRDRQLPGQISIANNPKLVVGPEADSLSVEQYRRLAATLHEAQVEKALKSVMVTSATPDDGKTLTVVNLALTLSASYGRRVLLIDGDLRRPSVHALLGIPNEKGLADVLRDDSEPGVLELTATLSVVTAGAVQENGPTGLSWERMAAFLRKVTPSFDWVLLDSPPVGVVSDAQMLVQMIQGVIFVIRAGCTPYSLVEKAVTDLGRDRILGTVLNATTETAILGTSYYQGYYGR